MSIRKETPCNYGECPYGAEYNYTCEYWCGEEEPEDYPEDYTDIDKEEECLIDCLDKKAEYPEGMDYSKEYWEE